MKFYKNNLQRGIVVFLLLLSAAVFLFSCKGNFPGKEDPCPEKGVLDLSGWDFVKDGPVSLDGEWEFYWEQFLLPEDFLKPVKPEMTSYISVPGIWNEQKETGERFPADGFATYRLKIITKNNPGNLLLKLKIIYIASEIYADNKKICSFGVPGKTFSSTLPGSVAESEVFQVAGNSVDLILIASNFHHWKGGIPASIIIGTEKDIIKIREKGIAGDLFLFGSIFIMFLYHLGLFISRREDKSLISFSLFCLMISIMILFFFGEMFFLVVIPGTGWDTMYRIFYFVLYLAIPTFYTYMYYLFPSEIFKTDD